MEEARRVLSRPGVDLHDPAVFDDYFRRLWQDCETDEFRIQQLRERLNYPRVAEEFRMIREEMVPVVVHYEPDSAHKRDVEAILAAVQNKKVASRKEWRRLQLYAVSLFPHEFRKHLGSDIEQVIEGVYRWRGVYDLKKGISAEYTDPADLIA